jgi:hypothetical protein
MPHDEISCDASRYHDSADEPRMPGEGMSTVDAIPCFPPSPTSPRLPLRPSSLALSLCRRSYALPKLLVPFPMTLTLTLGLGVSLARRDDWVCAVSLLLCAVLHRRRRVSFQRNGAW